MGVWIERILVCSLMFVLGATAETYRPKPEPYIVGWKQLRAEGKDYWEISRVFYTKMELLGVTHLYLDYIHHEADNSTITCLVYAEREDGTDFCWNGGK